MHLFLFTGPIQTGKSTALLRRYQNQSEVGGFLSLVKSEKRHFYSFSKKTTIPMESPENPEDVLAVGRFQFSKKAFSQAENWFLADLNTGNKKLMIIDEAGPLELQDLGFSLLLNNYLPEPSNPDLLLVVRENLVETFQSKWALPHLQIHVVPQTEIARLPPF